MASITRKILGKDKDICYMVGGKIMGVVFQNKLITMLDTAPSQADMHVLQHMLKKAKQRDGVECGGVCIGTASIVGVPPVVNLNFASTVIAVNKYEDDIVILADNTMVPSLSSAAICLKKQMTMTDSRLMTIVTEDRISHNHVEFQMLDEEGCGFSTSATVDNFDTFARGFGSFALKHKLDIACVAKGPNANIAKTLAGAGVPVKEMCA